MKKWLWIGFLLIVCSPSARARERAFGWCENGGVIGTVSGLTVTPDFQGSYPGCIVTVYLTGTTTLATIYADNNGTPLANPFQASLTTGYWFFYADNARYDVQLSGTVGTPFTLSDIVVSDPAAPNTGPQIFANALFKGPIPWRDVSSYMKDMNGNPVSCSSTDTSTGANTTGTINLSTPTALTLAAAKDFKNGCGIAILGAGPLPTIATPPSTLSVSSVSGNGVTVTITTTANHGILVGTAVSGLSVSGCSGGSGTFNGTFPLASVADTTHLTYAASGNGTPSSCVVTVMFGYPHGAGGSTTYRYQIAAVDGLLGITAASPIFTVTNANATLSKYNYNQLFWSCPATNAIACSSAFTPSTVPYMWLAYGDKGTGGALSCLGTAFTIGYSDQGFGYVCPAWAPSSPPASPVAQALSTTITSGGGSTALTLTAGATTAVTNANVYHDESSFLVSCLNDQKTDQATFNTYGCLIPPGRWWLSTFSAPAITTDTRLRVSGSIVAHAMPLFFSGGYKVESIGGGAGGGNFDIVSQTAIEVGSGSSPAAVVEHGGGFTLSGFTVNFPAQDVIWADAGGSSELRFANLSVSMGAANFGSAIHIENLVSGEIDHVSLNSNTGGAQQLIDFSISPYNGSPSCCVNISNIFTSGHGIGLRAPGGNSGNCNHNQFAISNWLMENEDPLDDSIVQVDASANAAGTTCAGVGVQFLSASNVDNSDTAFVYRNFLGFIGTPAISSGNVGLTFSDGINNAAVCVTQVISCNPLSYVTSVSGAQNNTYVRTASGLNIGPISGNTSQGPLAITDLGAGTTASVAGFAMMMPPPNASVFSTGAGSLAAGTYCSAFTGLDNRLAPTNPGETGLSNIICQTVGANASITYHGNDGFSNGNMLFAYSNKNFYYCIVVTGTSCDPNQNLAASPTKVLATGVGAGGWSYTFTSTAGATNAVPPANGTAMLTWLGWDYGTTPYSCFFCVNSHSDQYPVGFGITPIGNQGYNIFTKLGINVGGLATINNLDGGIYVDGVKYAQTDVGIQSALTAAGAGTVYLPPGTYTLSNPVTMTVSGQHLVCAGIKSTTLNYTSTTNITAIIDVGTAADGTNNLYGISINGCTISGNSHTTSAIRTRGVHRSDFSHNSLINVTGSAIQTNFAVGNDLDDLHTSSNEQAFTQQPTSCVTLDGPDASHQSTVTSVKLPICEGVSGTGLVLNQANNTTITAGTSEGNAIGLSISSTSARTTVIGTDFESNSTEDLLDNSTSQVVLENASLGSTTKIAGTGIPWVIGGFGLAPSVSAFTAVLSSGTVTHTFTTAYTTAAPFCTATWNGTGTLTGILKAVPSTTNVVITSSVGTDTATVIVNCTSAAQGN